MARLLTRKLGATLRALTFQRPDDDDDDSPYRGGYDIDLTYGRALPPSHHICYPISPTYNHGDRLRPEKNDDDGDGYGYSNDRYGYDGKMKKKPRDGEPKYVGDFDSKPVGTSPNKWEYEYGYGGRRVRCRQEVEENPSGVLMSYSKEEDMDNKKKKKKKKKGKEEKKRFYGEELEGVYGMGRGDYKRLDGGGDGGLFGRRSNELGGGGKLQKPRFGSTDEKGGGYDIPKYGVPWRDSEMEYGYGGRRWEYEDPRSKKRYGEGEINEYGKHGEIGKDEGGYRRSNGKYGYGEKKRAGNRRYTYGQLMPYEEEDGRWRQNLSSEAANYNQRYPIDDLEDEWMRNRNNRLWNGP